MGWKVSGRYRSSIDKVSDLFYLFLFLYFSDTSPIPYRRRIGYVSRYRYGDSEKYLGNAGDKDRPCGGGSGGCSSRSAFPAEPQQKPVKKHKKSHERAAQRLATAAKGREVQTGGGARTKPPVRAKARVPRYKLLTEMIRCK